MITTCQLVGLNSDLEIKAKVCSGRYGNDLFESTNRVSVTQEIACPWIPASGEARSLLEESDIVIVRHFPDLRLNEASLGPGCNEHWNAARIDEGAVIAAATLTRAETGMERSRQRHFAVCALVLQLTRILGYRVPASNTTLKDQIYRFSKSSFAALA